MAAYVVFETKRLVVEAEDGDDAIDRVSDGMGDPVKVDYRALLMERPPEADHPHFYKWSELKASKQGGPPPTCVRCGASRLPPAGA